MIRRAVTVAAKLVTLPPMLAHELAHALTAIPMADRVTIVLDDGRPRVGVDWHDERETEVWLSKLAPLILGLSSLLIVLWTYQQNPWQPDTVSETVLAATLAIWWLVFTGASRSDLERP